MAIPLVPALEVIQQRRENQIVVTTMGAAREWPKFPNHPLDFHYIPSAMGHAPMLGLGLALGCPDRQVIAFNGDGCMLMSLGCLVTVVASGATNLTVIVLENGVYEVTGGQETAGSSASVDYVAFASGAGFPTAVRYDSLDRWQAEAADVLNRPGPRFICLGVERVDNHILDVPGPIRERIVQFREALQSNR